jgi:hypothetical protein
VATVAERLENTTAVATCADSELQALVQATEALDATDNMIASELEDVQDVLEGDFTVYNTCGQIKQKKEGKRWVYSV